MSAFDTAVVIDKLKAHGYAAVLRTTDGALVTPCIEAYLAGGLKVIEITTTCPGWTDQIALLRARADTEGLMVGAGTIMTIDQATLAVEAGAEFLVSPVCDTEVIAHCASLSVVMIPGCSTPTEMWTAYKLGCGIQKLFPEPHGAAQWIKRVTGACPMFAVMPSNGTNPENAAEYISCGAALVGMGNSYLAPKDEIDAGNWSTVTERAVKFLKAIKAAHAGDTA